MFKFAVCFRAPVDRRYITGGNGFVATTGWYGCIPGGGGEPAVAAKSKIIKSSDTSQASSCSKSIIQ
jgi:hypothetical protein